MVKFSAPTPLLGGLSPDQFLKQYWQKKPLLVRQALPGFTGLLDKKALLALACRDDMESRFVCREGGRWQLDHGPFPSSLFRRAAKPWTALVQGLNLALADGDRLMRQFDFIPQARLDDLMVSYATDGGGVGPHFDNYDVFLIQGMGRRRWRIGRQKDQSLVPDLPIRILKNFRPSQEWVLEPGDLLYLPPEWAHDGIAEGECMTYSVGFRTAPAQELAEQFLMHLAEHVCLPGRYADPQLKAQAHPAEIGGAMIDQVAAMLEKVRWQRGDVRDFLGAFLTEPKSHVFFNPPEAPLSLARFTAAARRQGLGLDRRSQMLFSGKHFFINGQALPRCDTDQGLLRTLADTRQLSPGTVLAPDTAALLHEMYRDGFLHLE